MKTTHRLLIAAALACATEAQAHDSWIEPQTTGTGPGEWRLALGTGNRFPQLETAIGAEYLAAQGCTAAAASPGKPMLLKALRTTASALLLSAPRGASSCWVQLQPFEVTVAPDKVPLYLNEIRASAEIRAAWARMQQHGLPWRERYTKHARIDFSSVPASLSATVAATPTPALGMDLLRLPGAAPLAVGQTVSAVVLRDGQPLAGQALELRSESSPVGIWRLSDAQGRVSMPLPLPGRWLLRGVDLRLSDTLPDQWESRFVTLAFEVAAATASELQQLQLEHALDQPDQGDQRNHR